MATTTYSVEFRGLLMDAHAAKLKEAGLVHESSGSGIRDGALISGQGIHAVIVEASSSADATQQVADALGADAGKFSAFQAAPARLTRVPAPYKERR
jgi:hypothetical protein